MVKRILLLIEIRLMVRLIPVWARLTRSLTRRSHMLVLLSGQPSLPKRSPNGDLDYLLSMALGKPVSSKQCPVCGDTGMVPLRSTNEKICPSCATVIPWTLTEGQTQTLQPSRATRKVVPE